MLHLPGAEACLPAAPPRPSPTVLPPSFTASAYRHCHAGTGVLSCRTSLRRTLIRLKSDGRRCEGPQAGIGGRPNLLVQVVGELVALACA